MQHLEMSKEEAARGRVSLLVAMAVCRNLGTEPYADLSARDDWRVLPDYDLAGRIPICVGAGPSLDINGEDLRHADPARFAIFATDSAFRWLVDRGIRVDAVCSSELEGATSRHAPDRPGTEPLVWGLEERTESIPLFAPWYVNTDFLQAWRGPVHFYTDCGWRYERWWEQAPSLFPKSAARAIVRPRFLLCGGHLLGCCEALGAREIVLVGYDWQVKDGEHHCSGYPVDDPGGAGNASKMEQNWKRWQADGGRWTVDQSICVTNCTARGRFPQDMPLAERLRRG